MDPNATTGTAPAAGGEDYLDKAADAVANKLGKPQSRGTMEKITDGIRTAFEKVTGKKVSSKISN